MNSFIRQYGFVLMTIIFLTTPHWVQAGGAFSTTPAGEPVLWSGTVTYRIDPGGSENFTNPLEESGGGCSLVSHVHAAEIKGSDVSTMVRNSFALWGSQTDSLVIEEGEELPEDVTFSNAENYYVGSFPFANPPANSTVTADPCYSGNGDCLNSVIVDPNGFIVDALLGACARYQILALASIIPKVQNDEQGTIASKDLKAAQMVISGACVAPADAAASDCAGSGFANNCSESLDSATLQGVITHEVGHFLGLDHSLVEKDIFYDCLINGNCNDDDLEKIPTMVGVRVPGMNEHTLSQDDISTIRGFYPDSGTATCSIAGIVQTSSGGNGRCVEVVARKQGDDTYSVGTVSGAYVPRNSQGIACPAGLSTSECSILGNASSTYKIPANCSLNAADCGMFQIDGLESGIYDISLQTLKSSSNNPVPFVIEPCDASRDDANISDNISVATVDLTSCNQTQNLLTPLKLNL